MKSASLLSRPVRRSAAVLLSLPLLASCAATMKGDAEAFRDGFFEWDRDALDTTLTNYGVYHNVQLFFELAPDDVPPGDHPPYIVPRVEGITEVYELFGIHEVTFAHGFFEVGGYRYEAPARAVAHSGPSTSGAKAWGSDEATLYILKRRRGGISFRFRGETIEVPTSSSWVPSVYYRRRRGEDANGAWMEETVQVGLSEIRTSSRSPVWHVDGLPYQPGTGRVLELEGAVHYEGR